MGFLSKLRDRVKISSTGPQILPGPGMPGNMPTDYKPKPKFDPKLGSTPINPDSFPRGKSGGFGTITLPDGTVVRGGKGPYGGSCPALNEEVLLADNKWISAKDLKVGDKVATHLGSNKVTHIDFLKDRIKKEVVFSDNDKEESIVTSDSHPYYVQNEEGFVEVKDLKVGDQVGNFKVKEIKDAEKGSVVHISIDEAQTYYLKAGDKKVLSHNKRFLPPTEQTIEGIPISQLPFNPRVPGNLFPYKPKSKKLGIPSLPQNLDFLSRLPPNMMPEVDFSSLPKTSENLMTGMQPRMNFAFGGPSQMTQGSQHMMPDGRQMPGANHAEYEANMQRPGYANGNEVNDGGMVDFLNSDPQQKLFGIENRIEMLLNQKQEAEANRDKQSFDMIVQEINNADAQRIEIMNSMKPNPITQDFQQRGFDKASQQRDMQIGQQQAIDDLLSSMEKKN